MSNAFIIKYGAMSSALKADLERPEVLLRDLGESLKWMIMRQFDTSGAYWGSYGQARWTARGPGWAAAVAWAGWRNDRPLIMSSVLRNSWTIVAINDWKGGVTVGSSVAYAEDMHNGTPGVARIGQNKGRGPLFRTYDFTKTGIHKRQIIPNELPSRDLTILKNKCEASIQQMIQRAIDRGNAAGGMA